VDKDFGIHVVTGHEFDKINVRADEPNGGSDLSRDPFEEARELGLVLVDSGDRRLKPHLQIDLDTDEAVEHFNQMWAQWVRLDGPGASSSEWTPEGTLTKRQQPFFTTSKSGKGKHVYVILPRALPADTRIAMQAFLGSDPRREMFNLCRVEHWATGGTPKNSTGIVLFETHEEAERLWDVLALNPKTHSFMPEKPE
jgi:hypothetical protein